MKKYLVGLIAFVIVAVVFLNARTRPAGQVAIPLSVFEAELLADNVNWVDVGTNEVFGELRTQRTIRNQPVTAFRTPLPEGVTSSWSFTQWLLENRRGATVGVDGQHNLLLNILVPLIPWLLIFGFIWFFVFRQLRGGQKTAAEPVRVVVVNSPGEPPAGPPTTAPPGTRPTTLPDV